MHGFMLALSTLRAPIVAAALCFFALHWPRQPREVMGSVLDSPILPLLGHGGLILLSALLFSLALLGSSLKLMHAELPIGSDDRRIREPIAMHKARMEKLAVLLAMTPWISIAALFDAVTGKPHDESFSKMIEPVFGTILPRVARPDIGAALIRQALACIIFLSAYRWLLRSSLIERTQVLLRPAGRLGPLAAAALLALTIGSLGAVIAADPVTIGWTFGALPIFFVFMSLFCVTLSVLYQIYHRHGIPATSILICGAIGLAYFDINDNHGIRGNEVPAEAPTGVRSAFIEWFKHRQDRDLLWERPYPVYLVATEGGGLYAGVNAATTLALIHDNCPLFTHHVFAISAVSGGALGAAVFTSLVKAASETRQEMGCNLPISGIGHAVPGELHKRAVAYFASDFLSPVLASGLFPDLIQRFWPWPIASFDRAQALERSFEAAWRKVSLDWNRSEDASMLFSLPYRNHWRPDGTAPALLLNAALVSGQSIVISPMCLVEEETVTYGPLIDLLNGTCRDHPAPAFSLSAAVGLSARFPFITPAATHRWTTPEGGARVAQIVDGGYVDNSGLAALISVHTQLRKSTVDLGQLPNDAMRNGCLSRNLVVIDIGGGDLRTICLKIILIGARTGLDTFAFRGELEVPLRGLLGGREARSRMLVQQVLAENCGAEVCVEEFGKASAHASQAQIASGALFLGWHFRKSTLDRIAASETVVTCRDEIQQGPEEIRHGLLELLQRRRACALFRIGADFARTE